MPKGTVVTDSKKKMKLAPRIETGLVPCVGEAHENAYIDHCMVCLHHTWGKMMSYAPPTVESVLEGFAVPLAATSECRTPFETAEREGKIKMEHVTEKYSGCTSSYYVWVKA
jgi:hypothetical protein